MRSLRLAHNSSPTVGAWSAQASSPSTAATQNVDLTAVGRRELARPELDDVQSPEHREPAFCAISGDTTVIGPFVATRRPAMHRPQRSPVRLERPAAGVIRVIAVKSMFRLVR
jgi:hypothetical protein